jgi:hypothetical protein
MRARAYVFAVSFATSLATAGQTEAAPSWVRRHLTLPSGDWGFDVGLGIGHVPRDPPTDDTAGGINTEMAVGVTDRVELGVRTGIRFGNDAARSIQADQYGRLFDRQTFGAGVDVLANPELRVRVAPIRGPVAEVAFEGRVVLPFARGTSAGLLFGVPLAFHLGGRVRLDTGAYLPFVFGPGGSLSGPPPTGAFCRQCWRFFALSLPLDVWIQASPRVWLGPMTGILIQYPGDARSSVEVSLGFGFGYQITHYLDFKAMVLFPTLNNDPTTNGDARFFGVGAGVEIRIE